MKKLAYLFLVLSGMFVASCDDLLTQNNPDDMTPVNFWRNKADVEKVMASAYAMLENSVNEWTFAEVRVPVEMFREDLYQIGDDPYNYPNWVELYDFSYSNGNSQLALYWQYTYIGINRTNQIIHHLNLMDSNKISDADKKILMAEAKFLRAYYHMKLLLNWKEIVIRDNYITNMKDANLLAKNVSPRSECWNFIINDLKTAASDLPDAANQPKGRATSGAANSYLGYAYLTKASEENNLGDFKLASDALENVKGYSLVPLSNYMGMFDGSNENSTESIFELQFSLASDNNAFYATAYHSFIAHPSVGGWDEIRPSNKLVDEFKKETVTLANGNKIYDPRLYSTLFIRNNATDDAAGIFDYFNDGTGKVYGKNFDNWFGNKGRANFRKFLPKDEWQLWENYTGTNIPLMRYSNVILLLAEAYNAQNMPDKAITKINEVRNRAGLPDMTGKSKAEIQVQIEHERIVEFAAENTRWYDLRRWNKIESALQSAGRTGYVKEKNEFYPIPLIELNSNSGIKR